ncbi:MAG: ExbD/TolR family protein [Ferruginibacter sp.]
MAEILNNKQKNGKRCIKKSTRVDLTPMVDLGFLLITFFVFTTTMSTTTAMGIVTPKGTETADDVCESCVITLIPTANNKLYYYEGKDNAGPYKMTDYSASGLRTLLVNKKRQVLALNREPVLIIKPSATSTFKNLINIIDESNICMYKRYYLDKLSAVEKVKF